MSTELPDPISEVLEDTAGEARVRRMWRGIETKRARTPRRARLVTAGAIAAAAAIALFFALPRAAGPLVLASGAPLEATDGRAVIELDDASRIVLDEGARIEPLRNDASALALLLARGRSRFEVTPGGPRTWTIETGVATVEVVGTVFTVTRGEGWAEIEVERGVVMVRGERVPDRAVRLTRGQSIRVGGTPSVAAAADRASTERAVDAIAIDEASAAHAGSSGTEHHDVHDARSRAGRSAAARASDRDAPPAREDADALMARADEARRAGRTTDAALLLERAMADGDDPAAGIAAFTLGRLELDDLHRPDRAARAFARALELALPPRLREDAAARLVEAHVQAGDAEAARRAADAYLHDHPAGRHAARVRELVPQ